MNITRNGKIARLPRAVRYELNRRLHDGEQGKKLVTWLNALPEVQAIAAVEFGGRAIREQNLSEWKQGGYRDWLAQQEALEMAERRGEDAAEWNAEGRPPVTDTLARWVAGRYTLATRLVAETGGGGRMGPAARAVQRHRGVAQRRAQRRPAATGPGKGGTGEGEDRPADARAV